MWRGFSFSIAAPTFTLFALHRRERLRRATIPRTHERVRVPGTNAIFACPAELPSECSAWNTFALRLPPYVRTRESLDLLSSYVSDKTRKGNYVVHTLRTAIATLNAPVVKNKKFALVRRLRKLYVSCESRSASEGANFLTFSDLSEFSFFCFSFFSYRLHIPVSTCNYPKRYFVQTSPNIPAVSTISNSPCLITLSRLNN